jgi:hypothetical protein
VKLANRLNSEQQKICLNSYLPSYRRLFVIFRFRLAENPLAAKFALTSLVNDARITQSSCEMG